MGCAIAEGEIVPLLAQLECYESGIVYVQAVIYRTNESVIDTRQLSDKGQGVFDNYTFNMPDEDVIKVVYTPYENPGLTIPHPDFCENSETFIKAQEFSSGILDDLKEFLSSNRLVDIDITVESEEAPVIAEIDDEDIYVQFTQEQPEEPIDVNVQDDGEIEIMVNIDDTIIEVHYND